MVAVSSWRRVGGMAECMRDKRDVRTSLAAASAATQARVKGLLRSRYTLPVALVVALQLLVLTSIRRFAADPAGGDLCRDVVSVSRLLTGQNPYAPITTCGVLRH